MKIFDEIMNEPEKNIRKHANSEKNLAGTYYKVRIILCIVIAICTVAFTSVVVAEKFHDMRYIQSTTQKDDYTLVVRVFDTWKNKIIAYVQTYDTKEEKWNQWKVIRGLEVVDHTSD